MSEDYTCNEGIFEDDEEFVRDEVLVESFRAALKQRLDTIATAKSSAYNFKEVAKTLEDIAQDEALVSALGDDARRHLLRAEDRRTKARKEFYDTLRHLNAAPGPVTKGERFAIHQTRVEEMKAMKRADEADECLARAVAAKEKADAELALWQAASEEAKGISESRKTEQYKDHAFRNLPPAQQARIASDALAQFEEALAEFRVEIADAKLDYASRLQNLRTVQATNLNGALEALTKTTPPALPNADATIYGTKVVLRAVG